MIHTLPHAALALACVFSGPAFAAADDPVTWGTVATIGAHAGLVLLRQPSTGGAVVVQEPNSTGNDRDVVVSRGATGGRHGNL